MSENLLPHVSVCIPAFNAAATIRQTLDSIIAQTYPALDIVVADNRSTDATAEIVRSLAGRVRYVRHDEAIDDLTDQPSYVACFSNWNFVLSQGTGDFLALYHSDDLYDPEIVAKCATLLQRRPEVAAVFTSLLTIGDAGVPTRRGVLGVPRELRGREILTYPEVLSGVMRHGNFLSTPSAMIRRQALLAAGPLDGARFRTSADLDLWLRLARQGAIAIIDQPLLRYRVSCCQGSFQYNRLRTAHGDFFTVIDAHLRNVSVDAKAVASYEMERDADGVLCAMHMMVQGRSAEARRLLSQSLRRRSVMTSLMRPRRFFRFLAGMALWLSGCVGLGAVAGRMLYRVYCASLDRRGKPLLAHHNKGIVPRFI